MPRCTPGRYPAKSDKILRLRLAKGLSELAFCKLARISATVLQRAENHGCNYSRSLQQIANALQLASWEELHDDSETFEPEPQILDPTFRTVRFADITDIEEFTAKVRDLATRGMEIMLLAYKPPRDE